MYGRTIPVPRESYRIQQSNRVVIQDRRDGGAVTEPNIVQQSDAVVKHRTHRATPALGGFGGENLIFLRRPETPGRVSQHLNDRSGQVAPAPPGWVVPQVPVSYTHLRAHETGRN